MSFLNYFAFVLGAALPFLLALVALFTFAGLSGKMDFLAWCFPMIPVSAVTGVVAVVVGFFFKREASFKERFFGGAGLGTLLLVCGIFFALDTLRSANK